MSFRTFIPCDVLKPYIELFAISENHQAGSYEVLPDTAIVMGFQYSGKLFYSTDHQKNILLSAVGITGLMDTYRVFSNSENISTVLVIFAETGAAAFFKEDMHELFGRSKRKAITFNVMAFLPF